MPQILSSLKDFSWTLFLFTYTDFKTIVFPVTVFACAAAPVQSLGRLFYAIFWTWLNLLEVDVSNQYKSTMEDSKNRPWRPLPAGRISQDSATILRWALVVLCVLSSLPFGSGVVMCSLTLTTALVAHDEYGWAKTWVTKNLINSIGYASFEFGATTIMNIAPPLDHIGLQSIVCSALLIFTTIHAQDFSDVEGDVANGRVTLPIYAPKFSRVYTFLALGLWSTGLGHVWGLGPSSQLLLVVLGVAVGWRFYRYRTTAEDAKTFIAYNIWLLLVHILPSHARWGTFRL
ncbi:UbiA prenyltransferase family [Mycena olivaceomarginata]|nr:UbiA prenyltransferase family [Mycena olivaceomarginata]